MQTRHTAERTTPADAVVGTPPRSRSFRPRPAALAVLAALLSVLAMPAIVGPSVRPAAAATQATPCKKGCAYVTNSQASSVSVIDTQTDEVTATIAADSGVYHPVSAPSGKQVYVSNSTTLSVIDTKSQTVTSTIAVPVPANVRPSGIAFTGDGKRIFVSFVDIANLKLGQAAVLTLATGEWSPFITLPSGPTEKLFIAPDGKRVYTQWLDVIDVKTQQVTGTIPFGAPASVVRFSPDSTTLYASDGRRNSVAVADAKSLTVTSTIPTDGGPNGLVVSRDRTSLLVDTFLAKTLQRIDLATLAAAPPVAVSSETGLGYMDTTKDGKRAYIVLPIGSSVLVIDTRTLEQLDTIAVGQGPSMVAICGPRS